MTHLKICVKLYICLKTLRRARSRFSTKYIYCFDEMGEVLFEGQSQQISDIAVLKDRLLCVNFDATISVYDVVTKQPLFKLIGHSIWVQSLIALSDERVVTAGFDTELFVWNINDGTLIDKLYRHDDVIYSLTALVDDRVVSASCDETLRVWNVNSGQCLKILKGHSGPVLHVVTYDDQHVISGGNDKTIRVWNVNHEECSVLGEHTGFIGGLALMPDGRLVSYGFPQLKVWDVKNELCLAVIYTPKHQVTSITLLNNECVICGCCDGVFLCVWNINDEERLAVLEGHTKPVRSVAVMNDGCVVSAGEDGVPRKWDMSCYVSL